MNDALSPDAQAARREQAAHDYDKAAEELDRAARHLRTTARHFREGDVPRGCAHTFAAEGHVFAAQDLLKALAILHASRSQAGE